jgi:hypothetical protein
VLPWDDMGWVASVEIALCVAINKDQGVLGLVQRECSVGTTIYSHRGGGQLDRLMDEL